MSLAETYRPDVVLDAVLARYEAEGFDVFLHPSSSALPPFMQSYRPDAIALKPEKKIAIEIKRLQADASEHLRHLRDLFAVQADWELVVVSAVPRSPDSTVEIIAPPVIENSIHQIEELVARGQTLPALIMGWATLEALGRALLPDQLARAQPPARLVEVLATEGMLTPSEADAVRHASVIRNAAAHGQLDATIEPKLLNQVIGLLHTLHGMLPKKRRR